MKKRSGACYSVTMLPNANNTVIPYNENRRYLLLSNSSVATVYLSLDGGTIPGPSGYLLTASQNTLELRYEECGDLVYGPMSAWNTTAGNATFAWTEGRED